MEGVWKFNPFYWMALDRLDRANQNQKSLRLSQASGRQSGLRTNAFGGIRWTNRAARSFFVTLLLVLAPFYFFSCIQPASSIEAASYPELVIPSISLTTPVIPLEMTERQLIAPAEVAGSYSQAEHKQFIIGHSSTVFENLHNINLNDSFFYQNHEYVITSIDTVRKSDVDMDAILAPSNIDTIIIMTCAGAPLPDQDATHRLIVTAERRGSKSQTYLNSTPTGTSFISTPIEIYPNSTSTTTETPESSIIPTEF